MQLRTTPIDKEAKEKLRKSKGKMVSEKVVTSPYGKVTYIYTTRTDDKTICVS